MTTTFAIDLAGNFDLGPAVGAGVAGALAMLVVMYMGKSVGMTSMDLLRTLGTMVAPRAEGATVYGIGLMMHLMMGAVFGIMDAGILHAIAPSSSSTAVLLAVLTGVAHGIVVTMMMPMMLTMAHPLVKAGEMSQPGPAMTGFGRMTPVGIVMAHVVFGVATGAIYAGAI